MKILILFISLAVATVSFAQNLIAPLYGSTNKKCNWLFLKDGDYKKNLPSGYSTRSKNVSNILDINWSHTRLFSFEMPILNNVSPTDKLSFKLNLESDKINHVDFLNFEIVDNKKHTTLVFRLSKNQIDSIKSNGAVEISFQFHPAYYHKKPSIRISGLLTRSGSLSILDVFLSRSTLDVSSNLINNGSFEEYYFFPLTDKAIYRNLFVGWNDDLHENGVRADSVNIEIGKDNSFLTVLVGSDYFCKPSVCIKPYDGHFCAQIPNSYIYDDKKVSLNTAYNVSYLQSPLNEKLVKDSLYLLEFMILLDPRSEWVDNSLGVKFTDGAYDPNSEVNFRTEERILPIADIVFFDEPIILSNEWRKLSFEFKASGSESNICLGVFNNPSHKRLQIRPKIKVKGETYQSVFYIDNISLTKVKGW